jgi:glutathione S-transferase
MTSPLEHFGWAVSPYSAKTRSYLQFKRIPFEDKVPSARQLATTIRTAVGRPIMPTVRRADGTWMQDTSEIIDALEVENPEPAITPRGPSQRLASLLLELHADEWLPIVALHYRWNVGENAAFAAAEFGRYGFPWLPGPIARRLAAPMAAKMASYLPLVGVQGETIAGIEAFAKELISHLDNHFDKHIYLLGERPCLGDFALFGPLWAHLYRDPGSRELFADAGSLVEWMQRLLQPTDEWGGFLPGDEVPATLDPIFKTLFAEQFPFVRDLVAAIDSYCDEHPEARRVPRSLGDHPLVIGGHKGTRRLITFSQWMAQRPLGCYHGFVEAEREQANRWLKQVGGLDAMQLRIRNPFERRNFEMRLQHPPSAQASAPMAEASS